jgi:hypothetical protein
MWWYRPLVFPQECDSPVVAVRIFQPDASHLRAMLQEHEAHEVKGGHGIHQGLIMFALIGTHHHGRLELLVLHNDLVAIVCATRNH